MEAYLLPKAGMVPHNEPLKWTTIAELRHLLISSFYATLNMPANKVFPNSRFGGSRLINHYVEQVIVEYDETLWRSSRVGWYGWIVFAPPFTQWIGDGIQLGGQAVNEVKEPIRIGSSVDSELYSITDVKFDSAESFKYAYGLPLAKEVREELTKLTKVRPKYSGVFTV